MRPSVDKTYMKIALTMSARSTCPRRKVGCVLVDAHNRILSTGYNGVASKRPHCLTNPCPGAGLPSGEGLDRCEALHAEQNAILLLSDPYKVFSAYVTTFPCISCMKLLLGTSCQRLIFLDRYAGSGEGLQWWMEQGRTTVVLDVPQKERGVLQN